MPDSQFNSLYHQRQTWTKKRPWIFNSPTICPIDTDGKSGLHPVTPTKKAPLGYHGANV